MSDYSSGSDLPASNYLAQYHYGTCVIMRELVKDMHALLKHVCDSDPCDDPDNGEFSFSCILRGDWKSDCDLRKIEERMRKIGIEV